jgi:lysylphosphatidylglycerol synthetase-like protein (DUF2156 family)
MPQIKISPHELPLLRKLLPLICLAVPWELYFYTSAYSTGWGIKLSVLYANFDNQYGTLFVDVIRQLSMLSYGGLLPSVRTLAWFLASLLCIILVCYELSREQLELKISTRATGIVLIGCGCLTLASSMAVWNDSFRTIPLAPIFFGLSGYIILRAEEWSKR